MRVLRIGSIRVLQDFLGKGPHFGGVSARRTTRCCSGFWHIRSFSGCQTGSSAGNAHRKLSGTVNIESAIWPAIR